MLQLARLREQCTAFKILRLYRASRLARRIGGVRKGSASNIWQLSSSGERYLRARSGQARRRRFVEPGATFTNHTIAVNDLAVSLLCADRDLGSFAVDQLVPEPGNWRSYLGLGGETQWLKPDLHLITMLTKDSQTGIEYEEHRFLEVDLGTEHLPRIEAKCRRYAAYARTGAYQAAHGLFPAVVWLSPDTGRRRALAAALREIAGLPAGTFTVASPAEFLVEATGQR